MATFQDILDWLNQGAQGDIPGTGGAHPNAPQASQSQQPPDLPATSQAGGGEAGAVTPGVFQTGTQPSPKDYAGDIPLGLLPHYLSLVAGGLPPAVARSILTQPSLGEGESPAQAGYSPQSYAGEEQDKLAEKYDFPPEPPIGQHMWDVRRAQQQNLPVAEGQTQGNSSGLQQLPTGQYVPYPSQGLDYWAAQGNPSSFYWNPQPGSSWLNDLLGGQ